MLQERNDNNSCSSVCCFFFGFSCERGLNNKANFFFVGFGQKKSKLKQKKKKKGKIKEEEFLFFFPNLHKKKKPICTNFFKKTD
jgi:hypothetical protein